MFWHKNSTLQLAHKFCHVAAVHLYLYLQEYHVLYLFVLRDDCLLAFHLYTDPKVFIARPRLKSESHVVASPRLDFIPRLPPHQNGKLLEQFVLMEQHNCMVPTMAKPIQLNKPKYLNHSLAEIQTTVRENRFGS